MSNNTTCRDCGKQWSAFNACHCTECHSHFSGIGAFDAHLWTDGCVVPTDGLQKVLRRPNYAFYTTPQGFTTRKFKEA